MRGLNPIAKKNQVKGFYVVGIASIQSTASRRILSPERLGEL